MTPKTTGPKRLLPGANGERIPPLQNGDRLTEEEFERRYNAMPEGEKAELINGVVYMQAGEFPDGPKPISDGKNGERIPPLHNGDRLTIAEFERRYNAMPHVKKAELINGVVYVSSPVLHEDHGAPHFNFVTWLGVYKASTPGADGGDNSTLILSVKLNRPQPDAFLRILPECGGQTRLEQGYLTGGPELIAEISANGAGYDLHDKLEGYRLNNVREYIVWRVWDGAVDWFILRGDRYDRLAVHSDGLMRSETFPGLWLDVSAMLRGDLARVLTVLQQGLASPEHAAFVARLQAHQSK